MGQGIDGAQIILIFQGFDRAPRHPPAIPNKNYVINAIAFFDFMCFGHHSGLVLGIASMNLDTDWTALFITDQSDDHLLTAPFVVAIITEGDPITV